MMKITQYKLQNTIAEGETSGETYSTKPIRGIIKAIYVEFTNSTPASSSDRDVDIYEMNPFDDDDTTDAVQHILDIGGVGAAPADDNTIYYPETKMQDYQGTDLDLSDTEGGNIAKYGKFITFGHKICLSVSSAAAGDITTVYLVVEEF
jgi:hypothetical protein